MLILVGNERWLRNSARLKSTSKAEREETLNVARSAAVNFLTNRDRIESHKVLAFKACPSKKIMKTDTRPTRNPRIPGKLWSSIPLPESVTFLKIADRVKANRKHQRILRNEPLK
jgi:hypothetical protein